LQKRPIILRSLRIVATPYLADRPIGLVARHIHICVWEWYQSISQTWWRITSEYVVYIRSPTHAHTQNLKIISDLYIRPTQSMTYVPLLVNRFQKSVLLIVQYKDFKSCSEDLMIQDLILRARLCGIFYGTSTFCTTFCLVRYQLPEGKSAGKALKYFKMIHWVGRIHKSQNRKIVNIHTHTHTHTHTPVHHLDVVMNHNVVNTYIHTYIYTYIHMYIYTYVQESITGWFPITT